MTLYLISRLGESFQERTIKPYLDFIREIEKINEIPELDKLEKLNNFEKILKDLMPLCKVKISELKNVVKAKYGLHEGTFVELLIELWKMGKCVLEKGGENDRDGISLGGKNYTYVRLK